MTLKDWKAKGTYFGYKGHQIFTCDEGKGEVVVLIHGFPTASWDWWQMWSELTHHFRVLALDMIGFGFSDKPLRYPYSIFDQADLVEALLADKNIQKAKLLSHDYGDTVAQELLSRFNKRRNDGTMGFEIESLCFLNGGLFPGTHRPLLVQKILMGPFGGVVARLFNRQKLGKNFKRIFGPDTQPTEKELDDFWELITFNNGKRITNRLIQYMRERRKHRVRWISAIQEATIPIRLIDGTSDPISGQNIADRYRELIPNADVVELKNIGHFPLVEAPEAVLKHYFEFVNKA